MNNPPDVLIADDDVALCDLLIDYLATQGMTARAVHSAEAALAALEQEQPLPDALVLDVMLPGMSGLDALTRIRARWHLPVLMLSGRGEPVDRILGLELGADDYLAKPAMPRELVARLRALLRRQAVRAGPEDDADTGLRLGRLVLDPADRSVRSGDVPLTLTGAEFEILRHLLRAQGRTVSRETLTEQALGRPLERYDRAVDVHVSRLRRKLGEVDAGVRIDTRRGAGYLLVDDHAR